MDERYEKQKKVIENRLKLEFEDEFILVDIISFGKSSYDSTISVHHKICDETFECRLNNLKNRRKCMACESVKMTKKRFVKKFSEREDSSDYKILEYINMDEKVLVRHKCGKEYYAGPSELIYDRQSKCSCVYGKYSFNHSIEDIRHRVKLEDSSYELVGEYDKIVLKETTVHLKHLTCNKIFPLILYNFFNINKQRCPHCSNSAPLPIESKGHKMVESILIDHQIEYIKEKRLPGMRSPISGRKLRLDFYLPQFRAAIEYDGGQHFKASKKKDSMFSKEKLQRIIVNDRFKDKYLAERHIVLLRLNHTMTKEELEFNILNLLVNQVSLLE